MLCFFQGIVACQEDEVELYSGNPAISVAVVLDNGQTDVTRNIEFGFMEENEVTVDFLAKLEGIPVNYNREIKFTLDGDAIQGTDYELPDKVILPAGAHEVRIPCHIMRNLSLMDQNRTITLNIEQNDLFIKGFQSTSEIVIGDGMPGEWIGGDYWYILGHCSRLKYRFMYDLLGYYDLNEFSYAELTMIASYLQKKVNEYNMDPGSFGEKYGPAPMTDELGWMVYFGYEDPEGPTGPTNPEWPTDPEGPVEPSEPMEPSEPNLNHVSE